jgi:hypothetical protein
VLIHLLKVQLSCINLSVLLLIKFEKEKKEKTLFGHTDTTRRITKNVSKRDIVDHINEYLSEVRRYHEVGVHFLATSDIFGT